MEKQERRQKYVVRSRHQRKEKLERKETQVVNQQLIDKIKKFELREIISFMNNDYQKIVKKQKDIESEVNACILKRVQRLKSLWESFHRRRLISFLQKHQIPFNNDAQATLRSIIGPLGKKGQYYWHNQAGKKQHTAATMTIAHPINTKETFYIDELDQSIDFRIDFKRMVKDTVFLCTNFAELVQDVENSFKIKWVQQ